MKLTLVAATAVFSTANALYIPNSHAQRHPPHIDDGGYHVKDPYYNPSNRPDLTQMLRPSRPIWPFARVIPTKRPDGIPLESKTLPDHITPQDKKKEPVSHVKGCGSTQYENEESEHCVHYSHIQVHKAVFRSLEKRQKGPDPSKVDVESENAVASLLDKVAQQNKPLIPKKLGAKTDGTSENEVKKIERVIIYPKSKPKQHHHEFLERLIGKVEQQTKASDASGTKKHGKETTNQKDCDKEKNDELLESVIDKVEKRVKPQTPKFSGDVNKGKATEGAEEKLIEDLIEKVEDRAKPQIPKEKGKVTDDDEVLEDLLEQAKLQHKTRVPRWVSIYKPSPIEKRRKKMKKERAKQVKKQQDKKRITKTTDRGLRGYSPEYLSGLLRLEYDELCHNHPENCIKAKGTQREFTRETLEAKARLEDMKKHAMMYTTPEDFKAQRFRMDEKNEALSETEFWKDKRVGLWYPGKYLFHDKMEGEELERFNKGLDDLGLRKLGYQGGKFWVPGYQQHFSMASDIPWGRATLDY
ncbi:hypothetical protein NCS52_01012700 [Fusarium sp. LHS14.1]|nr:hypothetical protein NCS52_01012700 [Fusarium sp. LHS14.1]